MAEKEYRFGGGSSPPPSLPPTPAQTPNSRMPAALIPTTHIRAVILGEIGTGKTTLLRRCRSVLLNVGRRGSLDDARGSTSPFHRDPRASYESLQFAIIPPEDRCDEGQELVFVELRDPAVKSPASGIAGTRNERLAEHLERIFSDINMVVMMFDLSKPESLEACPSWMEVATRYISSGDESTQLPRTALFIGNKRDSRARAVSESQGLRMADRYHASYLEMNSATHDDDIDEFLVRMAKSALRLQRYQEHMALVGQRACPRDCTEGASGRPHRHLFLANSLDWRLEYLDGYDASSSVWLPSSPIVDGHGTLRPIQQPYPSVHRNWLRIILQPPAKPFVSPPSSTAVVAPEEEEGEDALAPSFSSKSIASDPRANKLVRDFGSPRATSPAPLRVATNSLTRPGEHFGEHTSMLTWFPGPPRCYMSLWWLGALGCFGLARSSSLPNE